MSHIRSATAKHLLDIGPDGLEQIRTEAREKGLDFHSFVASKALGKGIHDVTTTERSEAKGLLFALNYGGMGEDRVSAPDLREDIYLRIDRAMLCFTRTKDRTLTWQAHFQEGVILLSRDDVLTERVLEGNNPTVSRYKAVFQTVSGAVIAEGKGTDRAYVNGIDETGSQEAVTNMWEKVRLEVDRIRLLRGLALRLE